MSRLWINNLPPDVTEDELAALLEKYGFPPFDRLTPMPGERLAAVLTFEGVDEDLLRRLQPLGAAGYGAIDALVRDALVRGARRR